MSQMELEELVEAARSGSRLALEEVVRHIQGQVYGLSLRMLFHSADAEDASQEILIKVITNLQGFRGDCPFRAWVMRVAANHLKAVRKSRREKAWVSLDKAQATIDQAEAKGWFSQPAAAPDPLMEKEMRLVCIQALLMALDRPHRLAFVLGAVMGVSSQEGAYILEITPAAFRKRLSRGRQRLAGFLQANCGLFDEANPCHCGPLATGYIAQGRLDPGHPLFVSPTCGSRDTADLKGYLRELDSLGKVSALYQDFPAPPAREDFTAHIKAILDSGQYRILDEPQIN